MLTTRTSHLTLSNFIPENHFTNIPTGTKLVNSITYTLPSLDGDVVMYIVSRDEQFASKVSVVLPNWSCGRESWKYNISVNIDCQT